MIFMAWVGAYGVRKGVVFGASGRLALGVTV